MGVYRCLDCDQFIDNDEAPCTPVENNELICPDCAEKREEDDD